MGRHLQQRIAKRAVDRQQRVERALVVLVDQVRLVQQQQRPDAGMFGGDQVAVDQVGVRFGQRREDDDDQVDVGRHRLELAAGVGTTQFGVARQLRDDHADALVARAPYHAVAGDQRRQVGAQVAAEDLATVLAFLCFDLDLHAEVRDHQAELLRPQIAAFQFFQRARFAACRAGGAFFLDFLDAPVLAAVELAFGHVRGVGR